MDFFNKFIDTGLLERLNYLITSDFVRISYTDSIKELEKHNDEFENKVSWEIDLQTEHERYLCENIFKKPVFVTDYSKEKATKLYLVTFFLFYFFSVITI